MIFKSWTTPIKADVWAKYASYSSILLILAFSGNIISGYTEYNAANSFWEGVGIVLLLEGGAWIASMMFFTNLFSLLKSKFTDVASWIYTTIGAILLIFIITTSYNMSSIGKNTVVESQTPAPEVVEVDDRQAKSLHNKALEEFKGDSLQVVAITMQEKDSVKAVLSGIVKANANKKRKIMNYADYTYEKYANSIKNIEANIKAANKRKRGLSKEYKTLLNNRLDMKRAKQMKGFAVASSVRSSIISQTDSLNAATAAAYLADMQYKKRMLEYVIFLGICFTMLYVFTYNLSRYLSGSEPIYKNPFDKVMSPSQRAIYGLRLRLRFLGDLIADKIAPKETISIINKGFAFTVEAGEDIQINDLSPTPPPVVANNSTAQVSNYKPVEVVEATQSPVLQANIIDKTISQTPVIIAETPPILANSSDLGNKTPEFTSFQSVNNTQRAVQVEEIEENTKVEPVQRTVIQGFKLDNEVKPVQLDELTLVKDTAESLEAVEKMLKVFNYTKYYNQLMTTFTRMCLTKTGERKETKNYQEVANNRLEKIKNLAQLFVKQGYKVTHIRKDGQYNIEIDPVETPTLIDVAAEDRKVDIHYAPNRFNLPIFFDYKSN